METSIADTVLWTLYVSYVLVILRHVSYFNAKKKYHITLDIYRASETVSETLQINVMCIASGDIALVHR